MDNEDEKRSDQKTKAAKSGRQLAPIEGALPARPQARPQEASQSSELTPAPQQLTLPHMEDRANPAPELAVYLLHFSRPVQGKRHYTGSSFKHRLPNRVRAHQQGYGARLTRQAHHEGVEIVLARFWCPVDRDFEQQQKRKGHAAYYCPVCGHTLRNPKEKADHGKDGDRGRPEGFQALNFKGT